MSKKSISALFSRKKKQRGTGLATDDEVVISIFWVSSLPGSLGTVSLSQLRHIAELDLTDNLISEWSEVMLLLKMFPSLEFLNLSNNILCQPLDKELVHDRLVASRYTHALLSQSISLWQKT